MSPGKAWDWFLENWDTTTALILAIVFAVLGAAGGASDDLVRGATLTVLGLIASALIRLRRDRDNANKKLEGIETSLAEVVALDTGAPWRILDCELTWDISDRDFALFTKQRRMHFYRNDVMSLHDWYGGDGASANEACTPGTFIPNQFKIGDKEYSLISLPSFYKRGDELDLEITRELHKSFPADQNENVNITIKDATSRARMKVTWPADKHPTRVWLTGNQMQSREVDLKDLGPEPGGRVSYNYELDSPALAEEVFIFWNW
jgi:hypothetical protein